MVQVRFMSFSKINVVGSARDVTRLNKMATDPEVMPDNFETEANKGIINCARLTI